MLPTARVDTITSEEEMLVSIPLKCGHWLSNTVGDAAHGTPIGLTEKVSGEGRHEAAPVDGSQTCPVGHEASGKKHAPDLHVAPATTRHASCGLVQSLSWQQAAAGTQALLACTRPATDLLMGRAGYA